MSVELEINRLMLYSIVELRLNAVRNPKVNPSSVAEANYTLNAFQRHGVFRDPLDQNLVEAR